MLWTCRLHADPCHKHTCPNHVYAPSWCVWLKWGGTGNTGGLMMVSKEWTHFLFIVLCFFYMPGKFPSMSGLYLFPSSSLHLCFVQEDSNCQEHWREGSPDILLVDEKQHHSEKDEGQVACTEEKGRWQIERRKEISRQYVRQCWRENYIYWEGKKKMQQKTYI